jgi:uncharacterized protein YggE
MSDYDKDLDKAAKVLGANVIKMVSLILHKHDAAIIEASMEAIEEARAEEREACAKVAEQIEREIFDAVGDPRVSEFKPKIAAAIRARGQG